MDNKTGFCHCGCGQVTKIATRNYKSRNQVKGQPLLYLHGHNNKNAFDEFRGWWKGKKRGPLSADLRRKLSELKRGDKTHLWRGGISAINKKRYEDVEYKLWRKSIFERDGYKCVVCGKNGYLQADHIKPFSRYPEIRLSLDNGQTMCRDCHKIKTAQDRIKYAWSTA